MSPTQRPDRDGVSRREFLKAASAGAAASALAAGASPADVGNARLPQKDLGKTGVQVPILGLGSAPVGARPRDEAVAFLNECIDAGVTYLDTAPEFAGYGKAQEHLGHVLKDRRDEVFVVTKCFEPDGEKALQLLKKNLKELQIERADLVYAHSIGDEKMNPDTIHAPDGVCAALDKARRDGLVRFVGVSGHNRPAWFLQAIERWHPQVMMNAVSLVARHIYNFENTVWPVASDHGIGLAAMKVFGGATGQGPKGSRLPDDLKRDALRYALGLPGVSVVVVGMHDSAELKQNLGWLRESKPLSDDELHHLDDRTRQLAQQWGNVYGPVA